MNQGSRIGDVHTIFGFSMFFFSFRTGQTDRQTDEGTVVPVMWCICTAAQHRSLAMAASAIRARHELATELLTHYVYVRLQLRAWRVIQTLSCQMSRLH